MRKGDSTYSTAHALSRKFITPATKKEILVTTMMNATILLLISDSVARAVVQEALEHGGYSVMAVGDLGTAVKKLGECKLDLLDNQPLH